MALTSVTETVFPEVGKGMPDVITYLDEVPWSTAADVKPMLMSTMVDTYQSYWASTGVTNLTSGCGLIKINGNAALT